MFTSLGVDVGAAVFAKLDRLKSLFLTWPESSVLHSRHPSHFSQLHKILFFLSYLTSVTYNCFHLGFSCLMVVVLAWFSGLLQPWCSHIGPSSCLPIPGALHRAFEWRMACPGQPSCYLGLGPLWSLMCICPSLEVNSDMLGGGPVFVLTMRASTAYCQNDIRLWAEAAFPSDPHTDLRQKQGRPWLTAGAARILLCLVPRPCMQCSLIGP